MKHLLTLFLLVLTFATTAELMAQYPIFPGHAHNDYVHDEPLTGALSLGYRSVEIDLYCRKNQLIVSHLPFCLSKKPTIEETYFAPSVDSLLSLHIADGERLIYLIDFKHKPAKLLELLRLLVSKRRDIIYDSCHNPTGKIQLVLTGKVPLKHLTSEDYCFIDIDGRLGREYTVEQKANIYMYSFSYSSAKGKYGSDLYPILARLSAGSAESGSTIRIWSTPNKEDIWQKMLDAGVGIIHVDKLKAFRSFYQSWKSNLQE